MSSSNVENKMIVNEKQKVVVPPMRYVLNAFHSEDVCNQIDVFTKNDPTALEYVERVKVAIKQRTKPTVFGYIPAPPDVDITKQVIGVNGYFFKMTTTLCRVDFIWHDRIANIFHFWGPTTFSVVKALNSIRWRIQKCYENRQIACDDEDYSDMPALVPCDYDDLPDLISIEDAFEALKIKANAVEANANEVEAAVEAANAVEANANAVEAEEDTFEVVDSTAIYSRPPPAMMMRSLSDSF